ncbi:hypothetical protein PaecuDRAFT_4033 [Paenibacillus curdlanolyticus YK9]|uniref:Uncharacterized protein n=1 Tax=Paenibacillus curdlanolyticus YK9 TaxID=717606 RepID=E0IEE2_9BACL|nr:hypothetical protein [Paenibacillus curdlanolyticus]EFM09030.1 hypothetical protein PaecuDRAFT_4033 [Paenibacillus curdlanolyticus YK9]
MHWSMQQWKDYFQGALTDMEREQAEAHLYECDACLERWMAAMAEAQQVMPMPSLSEETAIALTDEIMAGVAELPDYGQAAGYLTSEYEQQDAKDGLFTTTSITKLAGQAKSRRGSESQRYRRDRRRTMVHYAAAVCITFALMSTGVLKGVHAQPPSPPTMEEAAVSGAEGLEAGKASYVERVMKRTVGLLDEWTDRAAGGEHHQNRGEN